MAYIGNSPTEQLYVAYADRYSGTGSLTTFNLSRNVGSVNDIEVVVAGSQKNPFTEYSISANGAQLIFNSAPAAGTDNIVVNYRNYVVSTFVPEDGSITSAMIQANAITSDKIAPGTVIAADILDGTVDNNKLVSANITGAKLVANTITAREIADSAVLQNTIATGAVTALKLANTAVTTGTYGGIERIPVITVDQQGRLTYAANVTIQQPLPNILMLSGCLLYTSDAADE